MTIIELQAALRQLAELNVYHPEDLRRLRESLRDLAAAIDTDDEEHEMWRLGGPAVNNDDEEDA